MVEYNNILIKDLIEKLQFDVNRLQYYYDNKQKDLNFEEMDILIDDLIFNSKKFKKMIK